MLCNMVICFPRWVWSLRISVLVLRVLALGIGFRVQGLVGFGVRVQGVWEAGSFMV